MKLNSKGSSIARRLIGTITRRPLVFSQVAFHHPANLYFKMILSSPGEKVDGEYLFRDLFRFQKKGDVYRGIFPIQPSSSSVLKCIGRNFSPYINVYRDTRRRDRYVFPMRNAFSDPEPTVGNRQRRIEILIVAARCPL